ncbi:MAG: ATP-binding protein [Rhodobacteraceae bacterium]|nr:ATP-binding protein [Paracoccaceae bacterium]
MSGLQADDPEDRGVVPVMTSEIPGTYDAVREALLAMRRKLSQAGADRDTIGTVEMVLAEILNNVVEHAYHDRAGGHILLKITCTENGIRITVADDGTPINGALPEGRAALKDGTELDDLPEGGFGWSLIRMLVNDLQYHSGDGRNHLRCVVPHASVK